MEVVGFEDHELGEHDGVAVRVDGVDPGPVGQVQIVGSREEAHQAVLVGPPHREGPGQGAGVHLHVIVADGHRPRADGAARQEPGVEGRGLVADDGDFGGGGGEGREHVGRC